MKVGDSKTVWHVLDLDGEDGRERWWCFDSQRQAEGKAMSLNSAQVSQGVSTASDAGGFMHWNTPRPKRKPEGGNDAPLLPSTPLEGEAPA